MPTSATARSQHIPQHTFGQLLRLHPNLGRDATAAIHRLSSELGIGVLDDKNDAGSVPTKERCGAPKRVAPRSTMAPKMNFTPRNDVRKSMFGDVMYPVCRTGTLSVSELPLPLMIEDNIVLDYFLSFARTEISSEPLEMLLEHREMMRERTREVFAPNELKLRKHISDLITRHIGTDAPLPVTIPGPVTQSLCSWNDSWKKLPSEAEQAGAPVPVEPLERAVQEAMRDIKGDVLPRFLKSQLGVELCQLHLSALLSLGAGPEAFRKACAAVHIKPCLRLLHSSLLTRHSLPCSALDATEKAALDFWLSAHEYAISAAPSPEKARKVFEQFEPKLPLFEVPLAEIKRIEASVASGGSDLFLTAQVFALNAMSDVYYAWLESADGGALLKASGISKRLFSKAGMPPPPSLAGADYADAW